MTEPTPTVPGPVTHLPKTDRYARNRPFLTVTVFQKASKNNLAGKSSKSSYEVPTIIARVNNSHLKNCNVIIDIINAKCIKNSFNDMTDQDVVVHYMEKYKDEITKTMDYWLSEIAQHVATAQKIEASVPDAVYTLAD